MRPSKVTAFMHPQAAFETLEERTVLTRDLLRKCVFGSLVVCGAIAC
jgi:hypothetical protein